jgi:hypothetical protein
MMRWIKRAKQRRIKGVLKRKEGMIGHFSE